MSTTTKNVGRVSIVPKGDWNINNTYIRLDLVTYDGNSYIAKKDVPKNIQLSNNNYWMLMASKGEQGEQGAPFAIMKSYASIAAMNADFSNTDVQNGQFVIIDTGNVQDPDNAKLYYKGNNSYVFVTDMSGAAGIQGPRGASAYEQAVAGGYTGTETQFNEDLANFKTLHDDTEEVAPFYAKYGVTTRAEIEAAINDKRQIYLLTAPLVESTPQAYVMPLIEKFEYQYTDGGRIVIDRGYRFSITSGTNQYIAELANGWTVYTNDLSAPAASAEAYAIGKRGGTDVESTDPTYHNNAKYYSEQAALIVDDVEQVMTATTVGPADIATFNASAAGMPFKGLMANIEPVQDFNGYSRPWLGGAGKNQLSLSMSFLYEKNTSGAGTWTNNQYVSNGVTFEVQLNNNNDVIGIKVNGTASANTDFVFIERAPISEYPIIENGCPSGGSDSTYRITTRVYSSDFGFIDYYDYGSGLGLSNMDGHSESFSSSIRIFSGYTASNLIFRPMIRFQFDEDETFEPYSNICPITGWTGCKLHHTGVSLIGGDAFIGNSFSKTANGYQLSYNGSSISNRASAWVDIKDIPAGRYTIDMLNPSYPAGIEINIRRRTAGSIVTMGVIINASSAAGRRTYDIPENTTSLQLYIIPGTTSLNTSITMSDIVLVRESNESEPYKGDIYNITFPSEIGTVYGGTLDVVSKKLTVTKKYALLNDPDKWSKTGINIFQYSDQFSDRKRYGTFLQGFLCSCANTSSNRGLRAQWISNTDYFGFASYLLSNNNDTLNIIKTAAANNKIAILYDLAEPLVYDITIEQVATLLGENNIWADIGDVTVTYGAYLETIKNHVDLSTESVQQAAEVVQAALASIPADYTELSDAVNGSIVDIDPGTLTSGYVNTNTGNINSSSSGLGVTDYIDIHDFAKIAYLRLRSTSATATTGMCFYDANKVRCGGIVSLKSQQVAGYDTQLTIADVPDGAYYARFTGYMDTATYGDFIVKGIKASIPNDIININKAPQIGNIFCVASTLPGADTFTDVIGLYDTLVENYPLVMSKNVLTSGSFNNYEYVFSTGNYNTKGRRTRDAVIAKPKILITAGAHGAERSAVMSLYYFVKAMCENAYTLNDVINPVEYHIIPVVCPWAYDNNSRTNENGVNINRNFATSDWTQTATGDDYSGASAGDQVETQVVQNWLTANNDAEVYIDFHNSAFADEISALLGLSTQDHLKAKMCYLQSVNKIVPYLKNARNLGQYNVFAYTGNTDIPGTAKGYGEEHDIMSFTFETSNNVENHGKYGAFVNAIGCEMFGATIKGMVKYVLLKDPINAAILG